MGRKIGLLAAGSPAGVRSWVAAAVALVVGGSAAQAAPATFDDVQFWAGSGPNRAAVVLDWNDAKQPESVVWGYRWSGSATGLDMLNAVVAADARLFAHESTPGAFGVLVYGLGYDADADGFGVGPALAFDAGGLAVSASPPADDARAPTDAADHYHDGWNAGFWSYWLGGTGATPAWASAEVGAGGRALTDGTWDGWSFAGSFAEPAEAPSDATPAAVPEPTAAGLTAAAGAATLLRRRRSMTLRVARTCTKGRGPVPSAPYPGERVRVRGRTSGTPAGPRCLGVPPLTPALSPAHRGEGARHGHAYMPMPPETRRVSRASAVCGIMVGFAALAVPAAARAEYIFDPDDFAVEVVSSSGPFGAAPYNDPTAVLGRPTLTYNSSTNPNVPPDVRRAKLIEGTFNTGPAGQTLITTLAAGSQITVRMGRPVTDDPANPFGVDFLVFGNTFYAGNGANAGDDTDLTAYTVTGAFAEPLKVSVSPDGVTWYRYDAGPYADSAFPTNSYQWDRSAKAWTTAEADPTRPVNPAVAGQVGGRSAADVLDLYAGSAGGTGFDLAASGFASVQFIRVEGLTGFAGGEVDAFADVRPLPEPAGVAVLLAAAAGLCARRRRAA